LTNRERITQICHNALARPRLHIRGNDAHQARSAAFTLEGFPGQSPEDIGAVTFSVFTNNTDGYNVTVEAEATNLTAAGSNTDVIPVADIGVRETDTSTYTALSSTATVTVHSQETRSAELPGDALSNDYAFINPIPDVKSDLYSDVLDYVATVNP
jgi:hypothetical protein